MDKRCRGGDAEEQGVTEHNRQDEGVACNACSMQHVIWTLNSTISMVRLSWESV
jgi:hypothetical protein